MPESGAALTLTAKLTGKSAVPMLNSTVSVKKNGVVSTDLTATVSNNNALTITKNAGASLKAGDVYTVSVKDGDNNTAQVTVTIKADTVTLDDKTAVLDNKNWSNNINMDLKFNGQATNSGSVSNLKINGNTPGAADPTLADNAANGHVKVTVTPGTTKFGTYEITGKYNNKEFKATFVYQPGKNPTEVTGKVASGSSDTVYELGEANAVNTGALFLDEHGVTVAAAAASDATHDTNKHGIKVATANKGTSKYLYVPAGTKGKLYVVK